MEIDVNLQEYLDGVKRQFNLDDNMTYPKVIAFLKREVEFRESLILSIRDKIKRLIMIMDDYPGNTSVESLEKFKDGLDISGLDNFDLNINFGSNQDITFMKKIVDCKLDYVFNVDFYIRNGDYYMNLVLNPEKLEKIKRYI